MRKQNPIVNSVSSCPVTFHVVSVIIGEVALSSPAAVLVSPPHSPPAPPIPSAAAMGANTLDISCKCSEASMTPVIGVGPK
jgi:hypothetical protein